MRASTQKARGSFQECARAFAYSASGLKNSGDGLLGVMPGLHVAHGECGLNLRRRLIQSDDVACHVRIELEDSLQHKKHGERF